MRRPRGRLVARVARRGLAATLRCAPIPRTLTRSRRRFESLLDRRDELVAKGLAACAHVHVARERPRAPRGVGVGAVKVAMDVTPLRLTRAGTARYIRNLRARLDVEPVAFGGANRASVLARELWWYPFRLARLGRATRRAALHDVLRARCGRVSRRSSPCTTSRCSGIPQAFPRWTSDVRSARRAARSRAPRDA